jgi:RimJ/RimL family protein N-acetyltransferase
MVVRAVGRAAFLGLAGIEENALLDGRLGGLAEPGEGGHWVDYSVRVTAKRRHAPDAEPTLPGIYNVGDMNNLSIRKASPADAAGIAAVLHAVASERVHSAIDQAWTIEEERRHLEGLSPREAFHVAVDEKGVVVGLQSLDLWAASLSSMAHVGQVGTFLLPDWRGQGIGRRLWDATTGFARQAGYRKFVIQVRASNLGAQAFYRRIGFAECGRLARQVVIDGVEDDEVLMEFFC